LSRLTVAPLAEFDLSGGRVIITAPFGDGRGHQGVDWGTTDGIEVGTPLYAPVGGYVEATGDDGPYYNGHHTAGRWLWFRGDDGTRWKMFHTRAGAQIPLNSPVGAGARIAEVGNTGTQAAHLHLEEHAGGWSNPVDFTADAYEVINAGRWPNTATSAPPEIEDDMTPEELRFEMTGQRDRPTSVVYPEWMHDSRNYQSQIVYEHATDQHGDRWWIVFGIFKWLIPHGYEGWWDQQPVAVRVGEAQGGNWQQAMLDTCMELKIGPSGALQVERSYNPD
jgi:hypothetical protein